MRWLTLVLTLIALWGCSDQNDSALRVVVIDAEERINLDAASPGLASRYVLAASAQGLVRFDAAGQVVPGLAETWIVTDDGRSFIFRLRNTQWDNGDAITADQVVRALRDRLAVLRNRREAADFTVIRDIRAMTGRVLEIRLLAPKPDLLTLLAQAEFSIRRNGSGTGPLLLQRGDPWIELSHRADEDAPDGPNDIVRPVLVRRDNAARAIASFVQGEAQLMLGGRFEHLPYLSVAKIDGNQIRFDPVSGLFGLAFVEDEGFLREPFNREAIAMAIDRSQLMVPLGLGAWQSTTRITPAALNQDTAASEDTNRWAALDLSERRRIAAGRVARWRSLNEDIPTLRIALPEGPGARMVFARIRRDLAAIGLTVERVAMSKSADLRLIDKVARSNEPIWYLNQLSCAAQRVCDEDADLLLNQARLTADPAARSQLLAQTETSMTLANTFIPLGTPVRFALVERNLPGFAPTENGWHPLPDFAFIPR